MHFFFLPFFPGSTCRHVPQQTMRRHFPSLLFLLHSDDKLPHLQTHAECVCVCVAATPAEEGYSAPWISTPRTNSAVHGCRAERSRCGSATNSCAPTGVQSSTQHQVETGASGQSQWMGGIYEKSGIFDSSRTAQIWMNQCSRSPAAATGLWSFVCAPFIHHLCFPGNRGLPAGTKSYTATHLRAKRKKTHSAIFFFLFHLKGRTVKHTVGLSMFNEIDLLRHVMWYLQRALLSSAQKQEHCECVALLWWWISRYYQQKHLISVFYLMVELHTEYFVLQWIGIEIINIAKQACFYNFQYLQIIICIIYTPY